MPDTKGWPNCRHTCYHLAPTCEECGWDFIEDKLPRLCDHRLRSPYPLFGTKKKVTDDLWRLFGDVERYVEPFLAGAAMLLARPRSRHIHCVVSDANRYISNFWRAVQHKPDEVAQCCDWPVNEAELPPSYIDQARLFKRLRDQGLTVKEIAKVCPMGKATEQNIRHRLRLLELPPDVQLKVHHGKLSQDAALKLLAKKDVENGETHHEPPVPPAPGSETTEGELQPRPESSEEEPEDNWEPLAKDQVQAAEAELRGVLEGFIDRVSGVNFDRCRLQHPDELLRLVRQAQKKLTAIKRTASKGKASSVRLVLVG
jgi:hypothetical protein